MYPICLQQNSEISTASAGMDCVCRSIRKWQAVLWYPYWQVLFQDIKSLPLWQGPHKAVVIRDRFVASASFTAFIHVSVMDDLCVHGNSCYVIFKCSSSLCGLRPEFPTCDQFYRG